MKFKDLQVNDLFKVYNILDKSRYWILKKIEPYLDDSVLEPITIINCYIIFDSKYPDKLFTLANCEWSYPEEYEVEKLTESPDIAF